MKVDWTFLSAALGIETLAIVLILCTAHGYPRLRRFRPAIYTILVMGMILAVMLL